MTTVAPSRVTHTDGRRPHLWITVDLNGGVDAFPAVVDLAEEGDLLAALDDPQVPARVAIAVADAIELMRKRVAADRLPPARIRAVA